MAKSKMREFVSDAETRELSKDVLTDQADAMIDIIYYIMNAAAKKGIDLDAVLEEVHAANMRKAGPDGKFQRREDGKILKPEGWVPPNLQKILYS
jgi:predicted HAD superfamily Cof-like phosphohydrolase